MTDNEKEIKLLENEPGKLLSIYQELIYSIVKKYRRLGYVSGREIDDLVQEINHKILERLPRIQKQYNGKSRLRTYFSVIVRNICREEFRKNPKVEEPESPEYYKLEKADFPLDNLVVRQEYQRLEKVFMLMFEDRKRFVIMLRFMMDLEINADILDKLFTGISFQDNRGVLSTLNKASGLNKKEKFEVLSEVLEIIEGRQTSPESLRKWYITRCNDCLSMMNGDPPRSMHTMESLQILIEKSEENKK